MLGGEGLCEVVIAGKVCGTIRYRRPTSDEKLTYSYELQHGLGTEAQLKELAKAGDKARKCHEMMIRDISIPFAKKIFLGCEGFIDVSGKAIGELPADEQFNRVKEYYSHALVDLVAIAYTTEGAVKKKS
jgi:hypothetical protein